MPLSITPRTTVLDGTPLPEKRKAATIVAGQVASLVWTMVDDQGLPIDLTAYATVPSTMAPTSVITWPTSSLVLPTGNVIIVYGTAAAQSSYLVSLVEISVDGGTTWQATTGTTTWSYAWVAGDAGSVTIKTRATDNTGNVETPGAGVTVTLTSGVNFTQPTAPATTTPPPPNVAGRLQESVLAQVVPSPVTGTITTAAAGVVTLSIDATRIPAAVFDLDVAVFNQTTGAMGPYNRLYLICEQSQFSGRRDHGPPTKAEIRLRIRGSSAAEYRLLDEVLFDDAELAEAITTAVAAWNSALPPVSNFDTTSFPVAFRQAWIDGVIASLFKIASVWYAMNTLPLQAGGVSVNDMDRVAVCQAFGNEAWERYLAWVKGQKIAFNMQSGFRDIGSAYGLQGWSGVGYY